MATIWSARTGLRVDGFSLGAQYLGVSQADEVIMIVKIVSDSNPEGRTFLPSKKKHVANVFVSDESPLLPRSGDEIKLSHPEGKHTVHHVSWIYDDEGGLDHVEIVV